jgi:hypothetical protein
MKCEAELSTNRMLVEMVAVVVAAAVVVVVERMLVAALAIDLLLSKDIRSSVDVMKENVVIQTPTKKRMTIDRRNLVWTKVTMIRELKRRWKNLRREKMVKNK